jgi:hypothetical protein
MDPIVVATVASIALLASAASWYLSARQRAWRAMRRLRVRAIAEAKTGEHVRLVGVAMVPEPVAAPLTGRPCAVWRVLVEDDRRRVLVDETWAVDFFLADGTGKALVRTDHLRAILVEDGLGSSGLFKEATPELRAFLEARGISSKATFVGDRALSFYEGVVEPGEKVAVTGVGHWERDPEEAAQARPAYRDVDIPQRLVLDAPPDGPLLVSDEPALVRRGPRSAAVSSASSGRSRGRPGGGAP